MHAYHKVNFALIGLGPLALLLSSAGPTLSQFVFPIDLAMGVWSRRTRLLPPFSTFHRCVTGVSPCILIVATHTGVLIPLHSHLGGNDVTSDYAKKITKVPH